MNAVTVAVIERIEHAGCARLKASNQRGIGRGMTQDLHMKEIDDFFSRVANATPITPEQFMREYGQRYSQ